jgi:hypothetical protein
MREMYGRFKITREQEERVIEGITLWVFIHNGDTYYLTEIGVYRDGMIDCWGLVNLDEFKQKVATGWVVSSLPEEAKVHIPMLSMFVVHSISYSVSEQDLLNEVEDEIANLNGRPTSIHKCCAAYKEFRRKRTEEARAALRKALQNVPARIRRRHSEIFFRIEKRADQRFPG